MGVYRNSKTLQKRGGAGRFERWDLDRDMGVRACPWCKTLSAFRPELSGDFIDPIDFNARVCRCGYDSRRGRVSVEDFERAMMRVREASANALQAAEEGADDDAADILSHQLQRELRVALGLEWLTVWKGGI